MDAGIMGSAPQGPPLPPPPQNHCTHRRKGVRICSTLVLRCTGQGCTRRVGWGHRPTRMHLLSCRAGHPPGEQSRRQSCDVNALWLRTTLRQRSPVSGTVLRRDRAMLRQTASLLARQAQQAAACTRCVAVKQRGSLCSMHLLAHRRRSLWPHGRRSMPRPTLPPAAGERPTPRPPQPGCRA